MTKFVYIGIIGLPPYITGVLQGGKQKPMETPCPPSSVSTPIVRDITQTKEYPGYLSSQLKVDWSHVSTDIAYLLPQGRKPGEEGRSYLRDRTDTYQRVNVTQAEGSVKTSKAQLEYVRSNFERMKEVAKSGAVSQLQMILSGGYRIGV